MAVDVDRQRMMITPVLRLVFSLTSLVDTSDFMEVGLCSFFNISIIVSSMKFSSSPDRTLLVYGYLNCDVILLWISI